MSSRLDRRSQSISREARTLRDRNSLRRRPSESRGCCGCLCENRRNRRPHERCLARSSDALATRNPSLRPQRYTNDGDEARCGSERDRDSPGRARRTGRLQRQSSQVRVERDAAHGGGIGELGAFARRQCDAIDRDRVGAVGRVCHVEEAGTLIINGHDGGLAARP